MLLINCLLRDTKSLGKYFSNFSQRAVRVHVNSKKVWNVPTENWLSYYPKLCEATVLSIEIRVIVELQQIWYSILEMKQQCSVGGICMCSVSVECFSLRRIKAE